MDSKYKIVQRMTERTKRGQRGGGEIKRRKKREEEKEEARQKARKKPDEAVTDRNSLGQLAGLASLEVSSIPRYNRKGFKRRYARVGEQTAPMRKGGILADRGYIVGDDRIGRTASVSGRIGTSGCRSLSRASHQSLS